MNENNDIPLGLPQEWPNRWTYPRSFFGAPMCPDLDKLDAKVAFLGVPFDQGTTNRPGARFGPNGIRDSLVYRYQSMWGEDGRQNGAPWSRVNLYLRLFLGYP